MTGRSGDCAAQRGDQGGAVVVVPGGEHRGADFAAVRALEQPERAFGAGGADHAPSGARGDRGQVPPLARVGIDQQQGSHFVVAHRAASPMRAILTHEE